MVARARVSSVYYMDKLSKIFVRHINKDLQYCWVFRRAFQNTPEYLKALVSWRKKERTPFIEEFTKVLPTCMPGWDGRISLKLNL